ncbi:hypothetical protein DEO23_08465 [Brachybacterium endophyticum]|uniref:DUF4097 domain-containing protein n=1 Tax=Brachybacterium endophyticum TaxID=2182385 RepID=A0A2U2RM21_9MICO|nr:DUF4097 family beta strand repeat-containing protein [Brachybacterium endophyticum]PWH06918.1 hypothetical protein DEO23_08465 [Brachybacterium endophyticum]
MPTTLLPPRPLGAARGRDRTVRVVLTVIALVAVLLSVGGIAARSIASHIEASTYPVVSSRLEAGDPRDLTVTTDVTDIRVIRTDEADEVTLALVDPGTTTLPAADARLRARWIRSGDQDSGESVRVKRPLLDGPTTWFRGESRDLLIAVPRDTARDLTLRVRSSVGGIDVDGSFAGLDLHADTGDITASEVSTTGTLRAATDVGDIDVSLADAGAGAIRATTSTGDISVQAPCCKTWQVDADSDVGTVDVDPSLRGGQKTLRTHSDIGDVTVVRR